MRIELTTSSLPRKCSTPELQRLVLFSHRSTPPGPRPSPTSPAQGGPSSTTWSGRRGSNPRPTAWKAVALPTELLPRRKTATIAAPLQMKRSTNPGKQSFPETPPAGIACWGLKGWARMDSNHRTPKRTDLQSVAVGHLATCPFFSNICGRSLTSLLSRRRDSNPRPADYKSAALPTELRRLITHFVCPSGRNCLRQFRIPNHLSH